MEYITNTLENLVATDCVHELDSGQSCDDRSSLRFPLFSNRKGL